MNEPLKKTLLDAAAFLEQEGVPYALIGGIAVSLRGQPRVTADVDMVIALDVDRARELVGRLTGSNFEPLFRGVEEIVEKALILPLRHRSTHIKVDLAIGLSGFERQAIRRANQVHVEETPILVASIEDLLIMKALAGRPRDDQDAEGLVNSQHEYIDWEYCQSTAFELGESMGIDLAGRIREMRHGAGE